MTTRPIPGFSTLLALTAIFLMLGCQKSGIRIQARELSEGEYIFIEYQTSRSGELLEGEFPRARTINGPTYIFNSDGALYAPGLHPEEVDTMIILLARTVSLGGTEGSGVSSHLSPVASLPHKATEISLLRIGGDGSIVLNYFDDEIGIAPGQEWTSSISRTDTLSIGSAKTVIRFTRRDAILHKGIFRKSGILH